jgi:hypothetical protein
MKTVNLSNEELTVLLICLNGAQQSFEEILKTSKSETMEQMNNEVQKLFVKLYDIKDEGEVISDEL